MTDSASSSIVELNMRPAPVRYRVEVGARLLPRVGELLRDALGNVNRRIAIVSNRRVFDLYGATVRESLRAVGYDVSEIFVGDGERFKTLRTAEKVLDEIGRLGFERGDVLLALGGGVVGDLAGFVAGVHLRGVEFVNLPTTLLAQIDASIGGKTGVNTAQGKNLVGVFHHPRLVVVDTSVLATLDRRDLTAGWCEAIKHGAAGDAELFDETLDYLREKSSVSIHANDAREAEQLAGIVRRHVAFKARIVAGDERESTGRTDALSRRILNFGHTVAHAIEAATGYRRFHHGEAVGRGMVAAAEISREMGLLDENSFDRLVRAVRLTGRIPAASDLDADEILARIPSDKKSVNGSIQWVLLDAIGRARITDSRLIPPATVRRATRLALDHDFPITPQS